VYEWKEEDLAQLQKATEVLYDQYKDYFSVGLIDSIKHAGK
jgi:hypothetical protein